MYCNLNLHYLSQECSMRILHPTGGRLSMRFNDLRLHNTDTVQVGTAGRHISPCHLSFSISLCPTWGDILSPVINWHAQPFRVLEYQKIDEKDDAGFDLLIKICYQVALLGLHTGFGLAAISSLCSNNFIVLTLWLSDSPATWQSIHSTPSCKAADKEWGVKCWNMLCRETWRDLMRNVVLPVSSQVRLGHSQPDSNLSSSPRLVHPSQCWLHWDTQNQSEQLRIKVFRNSPRGLRSV